MVLPTNIFLREFLPIFPDLKKICSFGFFIHEEIGKYSVIGIVGKSSSLLRKKYTIERIEQEIRTKNARLSVDDSHPDTIMFTIKLQQ